MYGFASTMASSSSSSSQYPAAAPESGAAKPSNPLATALRNLFLNVTSLVQGELQVGWLSETLSFQFFPGLSLFLYYLCAHREIMEMQMRFCENRMC